MRISLPIRTGREERQGTWEAALRSLSLQCQNFDVVEELLVQLTSGRDLRIQEAPFTFARRNAGRTKRNLLLFIAT